ncbi:hypothetical protein B0T14DRAFT_433968 [Immersiella caudata]|uniref:Zn(2)-C6 fungal-type domain-containing protein n=1 Tax=Immersiella caudata TaxID=314043 RepID=A0AA40BXD2_9PEZI|nr:hypothetical protein B0T14DRAFT_433968 [Immersiella caudata]
MEDEKKTIVSEPEDVLMQNRFPSSTVDAPDGHFYHIQPREHDMDPDPDQLVQQALASLAEHQEQQQQNHSHMHEDDHDRDLRELQALQEPELQPQDQQHAEQVEQHQGHHASVDELRLAAQLSQDLAPIMAEAAQGHAQAQGQQQLPSAQGTGHMQETHGQVDPDLHQQLQAELQNHDQELQNILPPAPQQGSIPAEHQYHSNAPSPAHHGLPSMPMDYQYPVDNTPPRKRSKVSRACDECRRKKIKCDAQSDAIEQPCTNCRRSSAQCLFSRVPQKRGPSKGYIKELADRINTIEGKLVGSVDILEGAMRRTPTETFPSPQPTDESRKRQYSSISGDGFPTPTSASARAPPWSAEHRAIRPFIPPERPAVPFNVNSLASRPATPPSLKNSDPLPPRIEPNVLDGIADGLRQDPQLLERVPEIDDDVFNCYLAALHPTFPVLARTKVRVQSLVSQCPPTLQRAFHDAFLDFTRPALRHAALINGDLTSSTERFLHEWELEHRQPAHATDLVYFQTTVMMALCYDRLHPRGSRRTVLITKAAGIGYSHRIYRAQPDPIPGPEFDPDSDHNVALRAWWTLVMFDRWNSIATGVPMYINNDTAILLPGLGPIVGDGVWQLLRLSEIIGSFVPLAQGTKPEDDSRMIRLAAKPVLNCLREYIFSLPSDLDEARFQHVHLAYWHTCLLVHMFSPSTWVRQIFQDCEKIIELLASTPPHVFNPLHHHFVTLISLVLVEFTKAPVYRDDAIEMIKDMLNRGIVSSPRNATVREKISDTLPAQNGEAVASDANVKNLQQLADLATATGSTAAPVQNGEAPPTILPPVPAGGNAVPDEAVPPAPVSATAVHAANRTDYSLQNVENTNQVYASVTEYLGVGYLTFSDKGGEVASSSNEVMS